MARSLSTIYNELTAAKEVNTDLDILLYNPDNLASLYTFDNFKKLANTIVKGLSTSSVAIWRLIMYVVAYSTWLQESLYDVHKSEITDLVTNREVGQIPWYVLKSKAFQYGDPLEWLDDSYFGYSVIDDDKMIITQAAGTVVNGVILMKVAQGVSGSLTKLDTDQLNAYTQYMMGTNLPNAKDAIVPAGIQMTIVSEDADNLRFSANIFYDSQVLNSSGELLSDTSTKPVEDAVIAYIQFINYDSKFTIAGLIDAIQAVSGVENVTVDNCDAKTATQIWADATDVILETGKQHVSRAGYLEMGTNYELDGYYDYPTNSIPTLTYIAS